MNNGSLCKIINDGFNNMHLALTYGLPEASLRTGYKLIERRKFNAARYPGYTHRMTGSTSSAEVAAEGIEYIFKKISRPLSEEQFAAQKRNVLVKGVFHTNTPRQGLYFLREPAIEVSSDDMETDLSQAKETISKAITGTKRSFGK